ncbi:DUF1223 domain-containing protein [Pedobacter rhodius]|uniref:DUF1223 domain-containing protein n=1 Tax=Pedobacter rhodius TaxID=3004098 RepID=A0ABT4L2K9_9SPHI|nr:DUF1223 domain-containing protein [Pedobacter sp. SJ11]MCZ4225417.1 DUF1223 domain-containing protein [Pedobacter sp. SJ11]
MVKKIAFVLIAISTISLAFTLTPHQPPQNGFAVVELFTSEGCSSCPPADALIARIAKESKEKPVYILAYHVDYWDRLGWKDSFSSARFSQRQNQYANWLHLNSVYTPQIVVNGTQEFIGSQEKTLRNALQHALVQTASNGLEIAIEKQTDGNISLSYQTSQQIQSENLVVAIVIPNATNKIERGENKGKTLSHIQIVSSFETFNLNRKEKGVVNLASDKIKNDSELIAFLQNVKTGKITAAAKRPFKLPG